MWLRVDDGFARHPKVLQAVSLGGPGAVLLWVEAACWAAQYLTDGRLRAVDLRHLRSWTPELQQALVASDLWEDAEDGIQIHDWLKYQPAGDQVRREREAARQYQEQRRRAAGVKPRGRRGDDDQQQQHEPPAARRPVSGAPAGPAGPGPDDREGEAGELRGAGAAPGGAPHVDPTAALAPASRSGAGGADPGDLGTAAGGGGLRGGGDPGGDAGAGGASAPAGGAAALSELTAPAALKLLAEAAGPRLVLHPPGRPHATSTGLAPRDEAAWCGAWHALGGAWAAADVVAFGEALKAGAIWGHLKKGVSAEYVSRHLADGLQQAAAPPAPAAPAPKPAAAPKERPKEWKKDPAPPADPALVKGDLAKGLAQLRRAGVNLTALPLRVVRDEEPQPDDMEI